MSRGFWLRIDHGPLPPPGGPVKRRLAVRAVVERDGRLLLVGSTLGDWKFPGGGVEPRETPEEALARELAEETGYRLEGTPLWVGTVCERSEGREVRGSLFEMESRYYRTAVGSQAGPLALEDYERRLGFVPNWVPVAQALATNQALVASGRGNLPPWVTRETRVLELLSSPKTGSVIS